MIHRLSKFVFLLFSTIAFAQTGHLMQGAGAVNMSMGGAATAQPIDITGAMQWNPATLSAFDGSILKIDVGAFFSSPELFSSLPAGAMWPASPPTNGSIESDRGASIMPAFAYTWSKVDSKHTFGASAIGISGFGVDFPQETNSPQNADGTPNQNWDPSNSSPISFPQNLMGFGHVESNYMLLQIGFTWAYEVSEKFSIGVQPNIDYSALKLSPNPLATPFNESGNPVGYPKTNNATAIGFGGQIGLFYDTLNGFKLGVSYKTPQYFSDFEFDNTYLDGSTGNNNFTMNYPAIYSIGLGYSKGNFDLALDYRHVDYDGTDGFEASGWEIGGNGFPTGAVNGFGWQDISIVSVGLQYKGVKKLPIRLGYTYSSNPIDDELALFSVPATAIIANAFQIGLSYEINNAISFDAVYHYGTSDGKTSGNILNPTAITQNNPLGKIPGSEVAYDMTTSMIMVGFNYNFSAKKATTVETPAE